jgi:predicted DNA-binding transcriptional regulator AlpA
MPSTETQKPSLPTPAFRRLLDLPEAAGVLHKSESQLRWMIKTKQAPPFAKIGGRIMFDADLLGKWLDAQFAEAS